MATVELFKFTDSNLRTNEGAYQWEVGEARSIPEDVRTATLCSPGVLHAYKSIEQALLMDRIHGNYGAGGLLWRVESPTVVVDDGTKLGVHELTLVEQVERPSGTGALCQTNCDSNRVIRRRYFSQTW